MASTTVGSFGLYATAFPEVPRFNGVAAVTAGPALAPSADLTVVRFHTKDEIKATFGGLAAADSEKESVHVKYETAAGVEHRVIIASIGAKATVESIRKATIAAVNKARTFKAKQLQLELSPAIAAVSAKDAAATIVHAAALTNYVFDRYFTAEDKVVPAIEKINVALPADAPAEVAAAAAEAAVFAEGTILARDVSTERADEMNPAAMEAVARRIAAENGMEVHVVTGEELKAQGLHMMYHVGQAAKVAPRYIELVHRGDPANPTDVMAVVGKGVCFDTGGLNMKMTGFMEEMHMDKGGAAAVLGAALATTRLKVPRNVVFVVGAVENAIGSGAYKPHTVIKSHKGLTVQVSNTDAEGRLVLGDALSLVQARHAPHTIIDLATLTGACVIALGEYACGVFSNSKKLQGALVDAGAARAERCWAMPIFPEHREELKASSISDIRSTGDGRYGGASVAAAFLEFFVGSDKKTEDGSAAAKPAWAHIDIAGPGMYSRDRGFMKKGGTGFGVQTVVQYLQSAPAGAAAADAE